MSKVKDPSRVVTSSAYLLFYRRRSDLPLGGPALQEIVSEGYQADSESQPPSRSHSPSGEGRRLGDFSRNGSSSALTAAGAAHQAGDGGATTDTAKAQRQATRNGDSDALPGYSSGLKDGEQSLDGGFGDYDEGVGDMSQSDVGGWSFAFAGRPQSQVTAAPPGSFAGEDLFDDNNSTKAISSAGSNASNRLASAGNDDTLPPATFEDNGPADSHADMVEVQPTAEDDDDELPVVELKVDDDEEMK